MCNHVARGVIAGILALACSSSLRAQVAPQPETAKPASSALHDLSGVWNMHPAPGQRRFIISTYTAEPPSLTPWAQAKFDSAKPSNGPRTYSLKETNDPVLESCYPPGVPRIYLHPYPMEIVQAAKEVVLLYEYDHTVRRIFTDGRQHPADLSPTYMGDSIGRWDGDTFVVDTVGFNDKTWLDREGRVHSDQLHVAERFRRATRDTLQIDIVMEDPKALAKPWAAQLFYELKPDWEILEQSCADDASFRSFEK